MVAEPSARTALPAQQIANLTAPANVPESVPATGTSKSTSDNTFSALPERIEKGAVADWPELPNIQFEKRSSRPGYDVWFCPQGVKAPRKTKTFLGYLNKGDVFRLSQLTEADRLTETAQWVAAKRTEKGIT